MRRSGALTPHLQGLLEARRVDKSAQAALYDADVASLDAIKLSACKRLAARDENDAEVAVHKVPKTIRCSSAWSSRRGILQVEGRRMPRKAAESLLSNMFASNWTGEFRRMALRHFDWLARGGERSRRAVFT